jgi:hypothetical protein
MQLSLLELAIPQQESAGRKLVQTATSSFNKPPMMPIDCKATVERAERQHQGIMTSDIKCAVCPQAQLPQSAEPRNMSVRVLHCRLSRSVTAGGSSQVRLDGPLTNKRSVGVRLCQCLPMDNSIMQHFAKATLVSVT